MSLSKEARQVAVIPYVGRKTDQLSYLVVRMAEKIEQLEAEIERLKLGSPPQQPRLCEEAERILIDNLSDLYMR